MEPPADHGEKSYHGREQLQNRVALITGGDSGIGRAVAIAFAKKGADVALSYLPEEEADADDSARRIQDSGRRALKLPGDLRASNAIQSLLDTVQSTFGRLDILVNSAAFQMSHDDINDLTAEELDHTFRTNVFSTFLLTQAALRILPPGAVILNTTSIQAYQPSPTLIAYAATKSAILTMTKSIAPHAMKKGVRVNAVAPGPVWTPLIPSTMSEEKVKTFGEKTEFGRPSQPVELARIFVFLASDEASYITGEVYGATGGRSPY